MTCAHCLDASELFDLKTARKELRTYKKRGPRRSTRLLIGAVIGVAPERFSLLDIGSGVGAIPDSLCGQTEACTVVDASAAYIQVARTYAEEQGYGGRTTYLEGDVVERGHDVTPHDVVTLDRVLCCYPDMTALVATATARCDRVLGLVFPRVNALTRIGFPLLNLFLRLKKSSFRVYLHPLPSILSAVESAGFAPVAKGHTLLWQSWTFARM